MSPYYDSDGQDCASVCPECDGDGFTLGGISDDGPGPHPCDACDSTGEQRGIEVPPGVALSIEIRERLSQSPIDSGATVENRNLHGAPSGGNPPCSDGSTATLGRAAWTGERPPPAAPLCGARELR